MFKVQSQFLEYLIWYSKFVFEHMKIYTSILFNHLKKVSWKPDVADKVLEVYLSKY